MRCERGQATIEWVGLVLLAALVLGALATAAPVTEGRSFGAFLSERIFCAVGGGGCQPDAKGELEDAKVELADAKGELDPPGRPSVASVDSSSVAFDLPVNPVGPCTILSEAVLVKAFCKARTASEEPSALSQFLEEKFKGCAIGATGAKAFTPFAEELFRKETTKSPKNAFRAARKGLSRAKKEVRKGKAKPGVIGCIGGTVGL